ncbi:uncharacterized protein LOC115885696 [Sitophilus oryzae]|uniref:Uncharacterized protein LOC115885696 n=1 Tax=Sitophilus oryzae TaxID=7048 RepID=A0A6J2YCA2_SITOR|nr:uncharacterized protein LOC115885696 [Sitophilus oryzae]
MSLVDRQYPNNFKPLSLDNQARGSDKDIVAETKIHIQAQFKERPGFIVDKPKPGFGNTNDDNDGNVMNDQSSDSSSPLGWPLCLGSSGIVIHLSHLDPSLLRNRECYLCVRTRSLPGLEVALIWKLQHQLYWRTIAEFQNPLHSIDDIMCSSLRSVADLEVGSADDCDNIELPELLQNLLVSVEHAIERVPLDDLIFPCPQCLQYLPLERQEDE